jgi:hypothetical protein
MYGQRWVNLSVWAGLAVTLVLAGCSNPTEKRARTSESSAETASAESSSKESKEAGEKMVAKSGDKEPLVGKGLATLKGKVTFEGTPPPVKTIDIPATVKEKDLCLQGDTREQTWKVGGSDNGVGDVVVWLRAPKGKYFEIPGDQQKADGTVKLDQPHCAFEPHVLVLYPTYYDSKSKKQKPTGQKFEVVNSAPFNHNTNYSFSDPILNSGGNPILKAKTGVEAIDVKADRDKTGAVGGEQKATFKCNIHGWMSGYGWIFDHPYAAVTTGDEKGATDFGNYEIKKAPAGVELELVYWHETMREPKVLKTITLKDGDNKEDIKISASN